MLALIFSAPQGKDIKGEHIKQASTLVQIYFLVLVIHSLNIAYVIVKSSKDHLVF